MDSVSRPLIALLLGTVAFFALWVVALKPGGSSSGSSSGLGAYSSAIQAAHGAVATSNAASAAHGGTIPQTTSAAAARTPTGTATTPAPTTTTPTAAAAAVTVHHTTAVGKTASHTRVRHVAVAVAQTANARYVVVQRALHAHKVLALLFYNPAATDDRAVKAELKLVPTRRGAVVAEAIPLAELSRYTSISAQVQVNQSPTLVVIDRARGASMIVGYTTDFEISQRIDDALAVPAS